MKKFVFVCFLMLSTSVAMSLLSESPASPGKSVVEAAAKLEKKIPEWKLRSIRPLSESVRRPFARNAWLISYEREAIPVSSGTATMSRSGKDLAEFILIPRSAGTKKSDFESALKWNEDPSEIKTFRFFLGGNKDFWGFANADVMTIDFLRNEHLFLNGDDITELLANALNVTDSDEFSRRMGIAMIGKYGNSAIPAIRVSMGNALAKQERLTPHLFALKNLKTREAFLEILRAADSGLPEVRSDALNALCVPPYLEDGKKFYLQMLGSHSNIAACIAAAGFFGWEKEIYPILKKLSDEPESFQEYFLVMTAMEEIRSKTKVIPELEMIGHIRLLLMRSGDVEGTARMVSFSDKVATREYEFSREDHRRIQPFEDALSKSKNIDMAILGGLTLYSFDSSHGQTRFSRDYTARVRSAGIRILRRLPKSEVRRVVERLKLSHSAEEAEFYRNLLERLQK